MASVNLKQIRTNEVEGYKIVNEIVSATEIPTELFVIETEDQSFSHVVTIPELSLPIEVVPGEGHYRVSICTKTFADVATALQYAEHIKARLDNLIEEYNLGVASFPKEETTTRPGGILVP